MKQNYKAYNELWRIASLTAFNVQNALSKRKLNQHSTLYYFDDNSRLQINATSNNAECWCIGWKGKPNDSNKRPCKTSIVSNKFYTQS